jgi:TM2 domain-containing membrane protein YozV
VLLAFLLGGIGAHHFYLGNIPAGIAYIVFCWTFIPMILAFFEMFMMKRRVREFNLGKARLIAARIRAHAEAARAAVS